MGLSPDSAVARESRPDDWYWDSQAELLAVLAELVDLHNRQYHAVNLKGTVPKPLEIRRPGQDKATRRDRGTTLGELEQMLGMTTRPRETEEGVTRES